MTANYCISTFQSVFKAREMGQNIVQNVQQFLRHFLARNIHRISCSMLIQQNIFAQLITVPRICGERLTHFWWQISDVWFSVMAFIRYDKHEDTNLCTINCVLYAWDVCTTDSEIFKVSRNQYILRVQFSPNRQLADCLDAKDFYCLPKQYIGCTYILILLLLLLLL